MSFLGRFRRKQPDASSLTDAQLPEEMAFDLTETVFAEPPPQSAFQKAFGRFRRPPSPTAKVSAVEASKAVIIAVEEESGTIASLAFGLRWRTLITTTGGKNAGSVLAKKHGGSHFLLRGHLVGYTTLPKGQDKNIHSASVSASKVFGGTGIFALSLGNDQFWIAVVRNNAPVNTDEVHVNVDTPWITERIRHLQTEFVGETVQVFTDIEQSGLTGVKSFSARDLFAIPRSDKDQILPVESGKTTIPKPVMITVLAGLALLALQRGYSEYEDYKKRLLSSSLVAAEQTPEEAWAPVFSKFLHQAIQPEKASYIAVRNSINQIPVIFNGWKLDGIRCSTPDIQQQADHAASWSCVANYSITRTAMTSEQMLVVAKRDYSKFTMSFPKLSSIDLSWTVPYLTTELDIKALPSSVPERLKIISLLQRLGPALGSAPEFTFVPYPFEAPKKKDGSPQPMPATVPNVMDGAVVVKAPLRSIDVLMDELQLTLNGFVITVSTSTGRDSKTINSSAVSAEISGRRYAIQ